VTATPSRFSASTWEETVLRTFARGLYAVLLLVVRALLAWVYLPVGAVIWAIGQGRGGPWEVGVTRFLRWIDVNFVVAMQRPARWLFGEQVDWVDLEDPRLDDHRILP